MENAQMPSFWRIVRVDYYAHIGALFPPVLWLVYAYMYFTNAELIADFFYYFAAFTVLSFALLAWRYFTIRSVFLYGDEATAVIQDIGFFRGRGVARTVYTYQGEKYLGGNYVSQGRYTKTFRPGDEVRVALDRNKPKRSFIREMYL